MNEHELITELKKKWKEVYIWKDKPNELYEEHAHPYYTKIIILEGNIELLIENKKYNLGPTDTIIIKKDKIHSAKIGINGCKYVVAEKKKK